MVRANHFTEIQQTPVVKEYMVVLFLGSEHTSNKWCLTYFTDLVLVGTEEITNLSPPQKKSVNSMQNISTQ